MMARLWPWIVIVSSVAVALLVFLDVEVAIRPFVVLAFLVIVPGMAIVRALRIPDRVAELTLGIALSVTIDGAVPGVLMYAGLWSSKLALLIVIDLTLAATILETRRRRLRASA
jgi:hypothetical protein